jgi:hypothetical protein
LQRYPLASASTTAISVFDNATRRIGAVVSNGYVSAYEEDDSPNRVNLVPTGEIRKEESCAKRMSPQSYDIPDTAENVYDRLLDPIFFYITIVEL